MLHISIVNIVLTWGRGCCSMCQMNCLRYLVRDFGLSLYTSGIVGTFASIGLLETLNHKVSFFIWKQRSMRGSTKVNNFIKHKIEQNYQKYLGWWKQEATNSKRNRMCYLIAVDFHCITPDWFSNSQRLKLERVTWVILLYLFHILVSDVWIRC